MPKYRIKLNKLNKDLINSHWGVIQAPNLNRKVINDIAKEVLIKINPITAWEIFPYNGELALVEGQVKVHLQGKKLPHRLCQCHHIVVLAISLGGELEQQLSAYMQAGEYLKAIIMQDGGSAALNQVLATVESQINKIIEPKWALTERYLVGYGDGEIADGIELLSLIQGESIGISFTKENTITPKQTMLAIIGVYNKTEDGKPGIATMPCQHCKEDNCNFREQNYRGNNQENWQQYIDGEENFTVADLVKEKEK